MFDELVESNVQNDLKKRRKFFLVSSVGVGILFSAAVVVSIYAADISLGSDQFELVEMIAPVEPAPSAPEPEIRRAAPSAPAASSSASRLPTRQVNMARVDESPAAVPTTVSTVRNTHAARPIDGTRFEIGPRDSDPGIPGGSGREPGTGAPGSTGLGSNLPKNTAPTDVEDTPPPPAVKPVEVKKPDPPRAPVSKGVLNGRALDLPKPVYSAAAQAVRAQGQVTVQVIIDEKGRVVSANAVSGHILLRADAEKAARNAKFSPTVLSDVPVKVTGVITYNFTR